ncbi:hypothetical protein ACT8ZV_12850 [Nocardioides sp. MAHUQ-72]|uniref:hypothetical protein n=1 Tax=unclassified Nocardioides TaxID=2615069 RepID=UPI00360C85C0
MSDFSLRGRIKSRPVRIEQFVLEDGIRIAVLGQCPWCGESGHRHAVPRDVLPTANLTREPRCRGNRGRYRLVMPTEGEHQ